MEPTISAELVESIVRNLHHDPFQVLGPHEIEVNGRRQWVVRAFVPDSTEVYLLNPETGEEYFNWREGNISLYWTPTIFGCLKSWHNRCRYWT